MTQLEIEQIEATAKANPTVSSEAVMRLIEEMRHLEWKVENYRKLAAYYKGSTDVGEADGLRVDAA